MERFLCCHNHLFIVTTGDFSSAALAQPQAAPAR